MVFLIFWLKVDLYAQTVLSSTEDVCAGELRQYKVEGSAGSTIYWSVQGGDIYDGGSLIIDQDLVTPGFQFSELVVSGESLIGILWNVTAGDYLVSAYEETVGSCVSANMDLTVTVSSLPDQSLTLSDLSICPGGTGLIVLANSESGITYQLRLNSDDSNVGTAVSGTGGDITFNVTSVATTVYNVYAENLVSSCGVELDDKSTVTVEDLIDPVAVCQNITIQLNASGTAGIIASQIDNGSTDNCGTLSLSVSQTSFDCTNLGINNVTLTVTDGSGNSTSCVAVVTVEDNTDPVISNCLSSNVIWSEDFDSSANGVVSRTTGGVTWNAKVSTWSSPACSGVENHKMRFKGSCGGDSFWTTTAIDISTFSNVSISVDVSSSIGTPDGSEQIEFLYSLDGTNFTRFTDNGLIVGDVVGIQHASVSSINGTSLYLKIEGVPMSWNDYYYLDNIKVFETVNRNIDLGECDYTVQGNEFDATATDNCNLSGLTYTLTGATVGTGNSLAGVTLNLGLTIVTWNVADVSGNSAICSFELAVTDNEDPVVVCQDITIQLDASGNASITVADIDNGSSDNCATPSLSASQTSFDCSHVGTNNVTLTVTDGAGNSASCVAVVTVEDNINPVADIATLPDVTAQCEVTSLTTPTATDNCDGAITGTHSETFPITASKTVLWTYTDGSGNISTQNQNVVINDNTVPVADNATLTDVTAQCEVTTLIAPTATDNC
ncbi:MAG: hypothetical protein COC06_09405, partial [Bacteroidales bacterium]